MKERAASPGEKATQSRSNLMQLAATMEDVISFGAGDPDLPTPPHIIGEAMRRFALDPCITPAQGLPELRRALAERYRQRKRLLFDPASEIVITNGAQEALFLTMMALVNPGDGVLVQDPRYSSYDQAIEAAGGRIVELPDARRRGFELNSEDVRRCATGARILVLINPNNPTGALIRADGVSGIAAAAREAGIIVVSDEVYEGLVYDELPCRSVAQCDGMRERTATVSSFSKTWAMTGFRVGYLAGPAPLIGAVTRLKQAVSGACPALPQYAALAALTGPQEPAREILATFERRRSMMMQGLDALGIPHSAPGGTFFIWADISGFGVAAEEFCHRLLMEHRVLLFPGSSFGSKWQGFVRISMLGSDARIAAGLARLGDFIHSITSNQSGGRTS
ncbi:MAG: pyridoxal phosphate-dependent aminotransferase [Acidobacteria bacterium]|nr:pyridoxal phosphate-dependent aminotransferase [Acidobacteriota bacterium]